MTTTAQAFWLGQGFAGLRIHVGGSSHLLAREPLRVRLGCDVEVVVLGRDVAALGSALAICVGDLEVRRFVFGWAVP